MAVLVLGGAGYIGSHTAYELIDNGVDVVIADNLETGHKEAVHPKARFYQGDIRDRAFLDGLFEKEPVQGVIHFAANSLVGESMTKPLKYYDNNLCGTKVLLESMVAHGVDKIVFSSTAATYGEPENIPILGDRPHPSHQHLRRDQALDGADVPLGGPGPRPAVCEPAVLQRLRRPQVRPDRRGPPARRPT